MNLLDVKGREPALDARTKAVLECGGAAAEDEAADGDADEVEDSYLATTIGRGRCRSRPAPSKSNSLLPMLNGAPDAVQVYVGKLAETRNAAASMKRQALRVIARGDVEGVRGGDALRREHEMGPRYLELAGLLAAARKQEAQILDTIEALRAPVDELTQQAENRRAVDACIAAASAEELVAAKTQLAALRSTIRRYRDEQAEIALAADEGPAHDEDEVGESPDADVEDEVGEETHADDEPLVDEPLDDADLALLEQIDERVRAVEDTERDDDDGVDLDEDAPPPSAKSVSGRRGRRTRPAAERQSMLGTR